MALRNNPAFKFFKDETKKPEEPKLIEVKPKKTSGYCYPPKEEPSRRPSLDKHEEELLFKNFLELEKVKRRGSHLTEIENLEKIERFQQKLKEEHEDEEQEEEEEEKCNENKEEEGPEEIS